MNKPIIVLSKGNPVKRREPYRHFKPIWLTKLISLASWHKIIIQKSRGNVKTWKVGI